MDTGMTTARTRRWINYLIAPDRQLKLTFLTVAIGLFVFFVFFGFQLWVFSALISSLIPLVPEGSNLKVMITDSVRWSWIVFLVSSACLTLVLAATAIVVSHRIFGPVVAIRKHLAALGRGEYSYRTRLRKNDEFKDVAEDLNRLSARFESGGPPSS